MSGWNSTSSNDREIQPRICFCFSISSGSWDLCVLQLFMLTLLKIKTEKYLEYSFMYSFGYSDKYIPCYQKQHLNIIIE